MAWAVVARAWKVEGLTAAEKLVLLRLADAAREDDGTKSFESQATIGRACGLGVRHVRRIIRILKSRQLIVIEPRRGPRPAGYHVLPDRTPESGLDRTPESGHDGHACEQTGHFEQLDRTSETARPDISSTAYKEGTFLEPSRTFSATARLTPLGVSKEEGHEKREDGSTPDIGVLTRMVRTMLLADPKLKYESFSAQSERAKQEAARSQLLYDADSIRKAIDSAEAQLRLSPLARNYTEAVLTAGLESAAARAGLAAVDHRAAISRKVQDAGGANV